MSCIPLMIILRSLHTKFFEREINNIKEYLSAHEYSSEIPVCVRLNNRPSLINC